MRCLVLIFAIFQCPPGSVVGLRAGDCYTYNPAAAWFDAEEECVTSGFPFHNGTYCLTSFISDEYWRSADCEQQLPSVCKIPPDQGQPKRENLCPSGWTYYDFTGFCYKTFHNGYSTWFTANSTCVSNGANLASIHSYQEQQFIQDLTGAGVPQQWTTGKYDACVWIGMIGATTDTRTWACTDGAPMDYTNWASTRPIDVQGCCTSYYPDYFVGWDSDPYYDRWDNDDECYTGLRAFVCKKPAPV
ncbi:Protein CLEC-49 [Aphelenchoides avenae]|nr:Protein CLEC-49 [Aphelenchus avenae]